MNWMKNTKHPVDLRWAEEGKNFLGDHNYCRFNNYGFIWCFDKNNDVAEVKTTKNTVVKKHGKTVRQYFSIFGKVNILRNRYRSRGLRSSFDFSS